MRIATLIKVAAITAATAIVSLIAIVKSIDFNEYKHVLSQQVRGATGRELIIAGPLELKLGLVPTVVATEIRFGNIATGSRPVMARIDRIEAKVALLPLLTRRVHVHRLILAGADILLETDAKGRANWQFDGAGEAASSTADTPPTQFDIREMRIEDSRLAWRDGATGETRLVRISHLAFAPENGGKVLDVAAKGEVDGFAIDASGTMGGLALLGSGTPWPLRLKGTIDKMVVAIDGAIGDPLAGTGIDLRLSIAGDDLAPPLAKAGVTVNGDAFPAIGPFKLAARLHDKNGTLAATEIDAAAGRHDLAIVSAKGSIAKLDALSGIELAISLEAKTLAAVPVIDAPPSGPVKASGVLADRAGGWALTGIQANLGASDLAGDLTIVRGERHRISGALTSKTLVLADVVSEDPTPAPAADGRLFSDRALPFDLLGEVDADVTIGIGRLDADGIDITGLSARLRLEDNVLVVDPVKAAIAGGALTAQARIDRRGGKIPAVALKLSAKDIEPSRLPSFEGHVTGARTDLDIDVKGRGNSPREIMATLSGDLLVKAGEGRILNNTINWAGDVVFQVMGALNPLARSDDTTQLTCAVIRFKAADGKAVTKRGIAVETAKVNVVGSGTIDLRTEALDFGITPRGQQGFNIGSLAALTRIGGTLAQPSLGVDALGTARTAASVGAAVATGGLSLLGELLFDTATADRNPCRTALNAR